MLKYQKIDYEVEKCLNIKGYKTLILIYQKRLQSKKTYIPKMVTKQPTLTTHQTYLYQTRCPTNKKNIIK